MLTSGSGSTTVSSCETHSRPSGVPLAENQLSATSDRVWSDRQRHRGMRPTEGILVLGASGLPSLSHIPGSAEHPRP